MIILPTESDPATLMSMHTHPGGHQAYNNAVKNIVDKIVDKFSEGRDPESDSPNHEPVDEEDMPKIKEDLIQWSKDQLTELLISGASSSASTVNDAAVFDM